MEHFFEDVEEETNNGQLDLLDGLDLQRFQAVQPCTAGPPHGCEEFYNSGTVEEFRQLEKWEDHCRHQLQGEVLRPDCLDENRKYPISFACSLLHEVRISHV